MQQRASGILLHITSLPSRGGIGDLGPAAYSFLDFLTAAGQSIWQVLPLGPTGLGNSPYSTVSAFAGNPLLISLDDLAERGWIEKRRLESLPPETGPVDFDQVVAAKIPLLREAALNFARLAPESMRAGYGAFCTKNSWWLDDYALFAVLRPHYHLEAWNQWPKGLAQRRPDAVAGARKQFAQQIEMERVIQFAFFEQWKALHKECARRGVRIMGDVAIFLNFDSADVWTHPDIFYLNEELEPEVVSGVPPDAFSETGQRWGNPLYRWDVLKQRGYDWWVNRLRWTLGNCDLARIDHFRGFEACWEIPADEPTAVNGRWVKGPGGDLFNTLRRELGDVPLIAEDLGLITPEVEALREQQQLPGMKVLQFGFGDTGARIYLPHRFVEDTVVYTGTHDNDTTVGWWDHASEAERHAAGTYFGPEMDGIHWAMIRAALTSVARMALVPLQDVLGLGSDCRMNMPSVPEGNWTWRYAPDALTAELAAKLAAITEVSDRLAERAEKEPESPEKQEKREEPVA
ncbi:MAG TPA: 4-alpha-glucanotransferase [Terriglobales bacterium]|nr:4-alpha-glucanotransferase [Terriglobales bacterium]